MTITEFTYFEQFSLTNTKWIVFCKTNERMSSFRRIGSSKDWHKKKFRPLSVFCPPVPFFYVRESQRFLVHTYLLYLVKIRPIVSDKSRSDFSFTYKVTPTGLFSSQILNLWKKLICCRKGQSRFRFHIIKSHKFIKGVVIWLCRKACFTIDYI